MNEMQEKYADDGLVIIAINLDNSPEDATAFLKEYPAHFEIAYDTDKTIAREFGVQAMPSSHHESSRQKSGIGVHISMSSSQDSPTTHESPGN